MGYLIPPVSYGITAGSLPSLTYLEDVQWTVTRRHLNQMPEPPLAPLNATTAVPRLEVTIKYDMTL